VVRSVAAGLLRREGFDSAPPDYGNPTEAITSGWNTASGARSKATSETSSIIPQKMKTARWFSASFETDGSAAITFVIASF
jgi:hypothetical protein